MSLRTRLLLTLAPLFILGLVAADIGTYIALRSFLLSRVDAQLFSAHIAVENDLISRNSGDSRGGPPGPDGGNPSALPAGTYGQLRSTSGTVIAQQTYGFGPQDPSTHPVLPATLTPGGQDSPTVISAPGAGAISEYRVYVDTARDAARDIVVVGIPLDDMSSTLNRLLVLEATVTGGVILIVIAATWLLVRRGLRPLERMGQTARTIVASDLSRRVSPSDERTEVGRLGLALNTMLAELDDAFSQRAAQQQRLRHFISDASHELRTPLTSMQGYAELLLRNPDMDRDDLLLAMRRVQTETLRMGLLVDDLLLLARLDQGRPLERGAVDLEALVVDACADARAAAPDRVVSARIAAPLVVTGDEMRLRQVLGNVVRNALVHTPTGSPIEVDLRADDGQAIVEVIDHGSGIPPEHMARVFDRFHRADPGHSADQGGSGLGLSIAAAVIAAHGGGLGVHQSADGGATFRVELPLTAPPAD